MKTIALKTNINCGGCVAKVTPVLNKTVGENHWNVNTQSPDKILTITTDNLNADEIVKAIENAGFKAKAINN